MSNPYSPPGETADDLWLEKSNLVGAVLGGVAYGQTRQHTLYIKWSLTLTSSGLHVAIFAACFTTMLNTVQENRAQRTRSTVLLTFVSLLFVMGTLNFACNTRITQLEFIDNRNFPGGPNAWLFTFYSIGVNTTGNAAYVIANFLADALLVRKLTDRT